MLDKFKNWWRANGQELIGTAAVTITALAIVYFVLSGLHWIAVAFLGVTGLSVVLKAIVTFSIGYTAVLLYQEWRDHKKDPSDISNLFHDDYDEDEDPRFL